MPPLTPKRKRLILIASCLIPLTAFLLVWLCRDSSYSERQRENWNKLIALLPEEEYFSFRSAETIYFQDEKDSLIFEQLLKHIRGLQQTSGPDWNIRPGMAPDPSLSFDGMTPDELRRYAETKGDPDAYLALFRARDTKSTSTQRILLKKAVEANRPGAGFLLLAYETSLEESSSISGDHYIQKLPGYPAFKALIDDGDFTLYKTLFYITDSVHSTPIGKGLKATLRRKAEQGDPVARRQLAEYILLPLQDSTGIFHFQNTIEKEKKTTSPFITSINEIGEACIPRWKPIPQPLSTSPTLEESVLAARWLKQAADNEDIQAMALWVRYGSNLYPKFSKKDWEQTLLYTNRLIEAGYIPIMKAIWHGRSDAPRYIQIATTYYSAESIEQGSQAIHKVLIARNYGKHIIPWIKSKWATTSDEQKLQLIAELRRLDPCDFLSIYRGVPLNSYREHPENFDHIDNLIQRLDHSNGPLEKVARSRILLLRGASSKRQRDENRGKAIQLLEEAWAQSVEHNMPIEYSSLRTIIATELMPIYVILETQAKLFEIARQYLNIEDPFCPLAPCYSNFFMALAYHKGYGTPVDDQLANDYYQQAIAKAGTRFKGQLEYWASFFEYYLPEENSPHQGTNGETKP